MNLEELLKACGTGKMPLVEVDTPVRHSKEKVGQVVVIKTMSTMGHSGCAVRFPDMTYDTWFHAEASVDRRKRYMFELRIVDSK